jgi:hypothetical protein
MTRKERNAQKVLDALAGGPLDMKGIADRTGLSPAAVSQAIYWLRGGDTHYITVAEHKSGYTYRLAQTVEDTLDGALNQARHYLTRAESQVLLAAHTDRLAATRSERAWAEVLEQSGAAGVAQAKMVIAALELAQDRYASK